MIRIIRPLVVIPACLCILSCGTDKKAAGLVLSGPPVSSSFPLICMVEEKSLPGNTPARFVPWKNPDQVRALIAGGTIDIAVISVPAAVLLYNKGIPLRLGAVTLRGSGEIISKKGIRSPADLKGETVVMPFRGDLPDVLFSLVMKAEGLVPGKDYRTLYCSSSAGAVQFLALQRAGSAFVSEVTALAAQEKLKKGGPGYHSYQFRALWKSTFNRKTLPVSGIANIGAENRGEAFWAGFISNYKRSARWCKQNPVQAAGHVMKYFPSLRQRGIIKQIALDDFILKSVGDVRSDLDFFLNMVLTARPGLIGGKMPGEDFYRYEE